MNAARETGFGTGLLSHLERGRAPEEEAVAFVEPEVEPAPQPEPAPEFEGEPEPMPLPPAAVVEPVVVEPVVVEPLPVERRLSMRALLRNRAEHEAERVWSAFDGALNATLPDGRPDHATRLAAAKALLTHVDAEAAADAPFGDELAHRRARREAR